MGRIRLGDNPAVDILLRRSPRARRLSLRVSALDGRVTLTLPPGAGERQARRFAEQHADWIGRALSKREEPLAVSVGATIPLEGRSMVVASGGGKSAKLDGERIFAPTGREGPAIAALLKQRARVRLADVSELYAGRIGRTFGRITLRDTRSRWGSCSTDGNLMYSWRLILAPPEVLDYVAAHEVAHLAEMNHSPAFWKVVADLCPHFDRPRKWLRREGHSLHRFRFDTESCD